MERKTGEVNHVKLSTQKPVCLHLNGNQKKEENVMRISLDSCRTVVRQEPLREKTLKPKTCLSCRKLEEELAFKNKVIKELSDDRDVLKVRLTEVQNKNVELELKMQKYRKPSVQSERISSQRKSKPESQQNVEVATMKDKCNELEEINKHLQEHLRNLRKVFNDVHCNSNCSGSQKSKASSQGNPVRNGRTGKYSDETIDSSQLSTVDDSRHAFDSWFDKR